MICLYFLQNIQQKYTNKISKILKLNTILSINLSNIFEYKPKNTDKNQV